MDRRKLSVRLLPVLAWDTFQRAAGQRLWHGPAPKFREACIRCPVLQMDPRQRPRLLEIIQNLRERTPRPAETAGSARSKDSRSASTPRWPSSTASSGPRPMAGPSWSTSARRSSPTTHHRLTEAGASSGLTGAGWRAAKTGHWGEPKRGHEGKGGAQRWSAAPAKRRAELPAHSDDTSAHGVLGPSAHSAWSIRALAAFSCSSMCFGVSPRASDMETTALRLPLSVTPLRVM